MPISAISGSAGSVLMEKALSNQGKANSLEHLADPLEDAATKQLDARDIAALAEAVKAKASSQVKSPTENPLSKSNAIPEPAPAGVGRLDIKA
ncbi:MAG TPA: hypothetical protein VIV60_08745 [Polyangiaceae bacterium]